MPQAPGDAAVHARGLARRHVAGGDAKGEGAGAEGDLRLAGLAAAMAEEGGLLVYEAGAQGQFSDAAEIPGGGTDLRQDLQGNAEEAAELGIPLAGAEIHQAGPRGGGDVGGIDPRQAVEEEAVAGAEPQAATGHETLGLGKLVQDPFQLAGGKIGIEGKPGALPRW